MSTSIDIQPRAKRPDSEACVVVIDDDPDFLNSVGRLLRSAGLHPQLFASVADFLAFEMPDAPTCLILDVRTSGTERTGLSADLAAASVCLPIVFMTGHGDIPMSVQAMKAGAVEFLTKPFRDQDLLDAVNVGLERDRVRRANEEDLNALRMRLEVLTPRERAILLQVVRAGSTSRSPATWALPRPR